MFPDTPRRNNACAIWNAKQGETEANAISAHGYIRLSVFGSLILGHRIVWAMEYGEWPSVIDHINGDKTDNRLSNLRQVSIAENNRNLPRRTGNTSGATGVCLSRNGKWRAFITIDGKQIHLGEHKLKSDAIKHRKKAEADFGFHINHGRVKTSG
jgi:hypothetical protein